MVAAAFQTLDALPRRPFGITPTPFDPAPALARELGWDPARFHLKLDAHNGFGLGGNKVRKLEYVLAPPYLGGITTLITCGGVQSNHARVTAAAAARLGLDCVLVLNGDPPAAPTGNALLHRLLGARVVSVSDSTKRDAAMEAEAREIEDNGGGALVIPLGASTPLGALGYVPAAREFVQQLEGVEAASGRIPTTIFMASSSCGTLAGLSLGLTLTGRDDIRVVAVSADVPAEEIVRETGRLAGGAANLLGLEALEAVGPRAAHALERVVAQDGYVGEGYAIPTPAGEEAQSLFATRAGVVVDPVYSAKAASGLVDWLRSGRVASSERVVFWHTGGHPAVLA
jgi:1-aminocyclopropane-1-carboxylate deaminase/D-cysteine desulfhydrase-like pyridoxal-dependent ACC family enzyme